MGLPTSNSHERVSPAVSAVEATSATGTSIGRKLRSFPWSRSSADKKQQKRATVSARERIVSSAGPDAPRPGPSILKTSSSSSLPAKNGPGYSPSLPMGFPAPPPSTTSSSASISTGTSFASTSMFASFSSSTATDDAGWHSEATSVSLNSSPEMGAGGFSNDSLIKLRNFRRAAKESSSSSSEAAAAPRTNNGGGVRPFSILSDIVERDNEDGRASMYDVLSMYSVPTSTHGPDVPVRRVSTPIPPAVALMLASEPATPPRQKRWSTSSIDESSSSSPSGRDRLLSAEADDEISPRRRRNSFDSPGTRTKTEAAAAAQRRPASSIRIPSMRFDGISMEAMFAEVEARMNRQLAAKQLAAGAPQSRAAAAATESTTTAANLPDAVKKQARRKSRVMSLQEPLSFEISTPVFASASNATTTSRREETIIEEDEEAEEEADSLPPPVVVAASLHRLPNRTSSRPEPLNVHAANSNISSRWSPRSAPLQSTGPFFASSRAAVVVTPTCESPTSPTPAKGAFSALLPPVVEPEQVTNSAAGQASPRLQGSIPELLVCPPSPPERPKRRAPPPPPLRLGPNPHPSSASSSVVAKQQRPFPKMQQPPSPASLTSAVTRPTTMVNGETRVTLVQTEKKFVRLSTRAQPARRRTDRGRTFSVPVQPTRAMQQQPSPQTPSTPTFEITPPPPDSPVAEQPTVAAETVALPISEPSTPVRRFMDEGAADLSPRSVSPTPSSTPTVTAAPYHPPNVLRTDYHPALSNLTVAYPNSDDSSSECEESFQDMLIRLNRPHTPPRNKSKKPPVEESAPAVATSPTSSLTKSAMQAHNTSHSRLSMLARELGEAMAAKENMPPAIRRHQSLARPSSTDTRRYSKLFAAGEVDLDRFGFEFEGAPVLVSQAEPQSPTLMHHLRPIDSEHGHGGEDDDESWTAAQGSQADEVAPPAAVAVKSNAAVDDDDQPLDLESELDRTIASLISDESTATSSAGDAMSRSDSQHSHQRTDSDSSLASLEDEDEDAGAVIVEAKVVVPRSPVLGSGGGGGGSGHRSHPSDSSIGSSTSTDAEEGVVCLGERISCSYNVGVIGVAM